MTTLTPSDTAHFLTAPTSDPRWQGIAGVVNVVICKWLGWTEIEWYQLPSEPEEPPFRWGKAPGDSGIWRQLTCYTHGPTALGNLWEAIEKLPADQREDFIEYLGESVRDKCIDEGYLPRDLSELQIIFLHTHAPAPHRCIALLRVVAPGMFEEGRP